MKHFAVFVLSSLMLFATSCSMENDINCDESLIGGEVNGTTLTEKTYSVEGMELNLRVEDPASGQFFSTYPDVAESECNKIT